MRELPLNQVRPEAQPLSTFIQPAQRQVAAPAGPLEIPRVGQINVIQQGNGGSVAGFNRFAQVAQALAPFNQQLTQLASSGLTMYAQQQAQEGVNEALRAKALLDEQAAQSGAEYAAENRSLSVRDPIGALMMDRVNPWRAGGRQRTLTRLAALEAQGAMVQAFRGMEAPYLLKEGAPELGKLKADVIAQLTDKYKLNQDSPGFAQDFLPEVNKGTDKVTEMHWSSRQSYLKDTIPRTATAELLGIFSKAYETGQIQVGDEIITQATPLQWEAALRANFAFALDRITAEVGIAGEVTAAKTKAIEGVLAVADRFGNTKLREVVLGTQIGPPDKYGYRAQAASFLAQEAIDSEMKYGDYFYKKQQQDQERLGQTYQSEIFDKTYGLPDGPERLRAIETLRQDPRFQNLPVSQKLELEQKISTSIDTVVARGRSVEGASQLLLDMEGRFGSQWNQSQADAEFEAALQGAPEDKKPGLRQQYASLRRRKGEEAAAPTTREANGLIDRKIKANLLAMYPRTITEASLRDKDVVELMSGLTDANAAVSAQRQYGAYQAYVRRSLAAAESKKGAPLTTAEALEVTSRALEEYGSKDADAKRYLFPGANGQPGVAGSKPAPAAEAPEKPKIPPGTKPAAKPVYPAAQLDNLPDRQSRLKSWRSEPVLSAQAVAAEANRIISGQPPSAALQRFARDAGVSPGELLNRHLSYYPGIEASAEERRKLVRDGRQSQAVRSTASTVASRSAKDSPVRAATGFMLDLLLGVTPAVAAPRPQRYPSAVGAGGGQVAMRSGGASSGGATPLSRLIGSHESYGGNYGAFNRGGSNSGHTAHGSGVDPGLTSMTIAEIQRRQLAPGVPRNQQLHAVGKYQIIGKTLQNLMKGNYGPTGITPADRFTPAVQEKLFAALARGRIVRGDVEATMRGLQQEWIGLQYADKAKLRQATIDLMRSAGML